MQKHKHTVGIIYDHQDVCTKAAGHSVLKEIGACCPVPTLPANLRGAVALLIQALTPRFILGRSLVLVFFIVVTKYLKNLTSGMVDFGSV